MSIENTQDRTISCENLSLNCLEFEVPVSCVGSYFPEEDPEKSEKNSHYIDLNSKYTIPLFAIHEVSLPFQEKVADRISVPVSHTVSIRGSR